MSGTEEITDSKTGWVATHVRRYLASDGGSGHIWYGKPTLLILTRGRRSGVLRRTALIYGKDGDNYVLVASNGGADNHPAWYLNLVDNPEVQLQIKDEKLNARARTATPDERPRLWDLMAEILPQYNSYRKKAKREIPVIILEPIKD